MISFVAIQKSSVKRAKHRFATHTHAPTSTTTSVAHKLTENSHASQIRARSFSTTNEYTRINFFRPIKFECVFFEKQRVRRSDFDTFQLSHLHFRNCENNNLELAFEHVSISIENEWNTWATTWSFKASSTVYSTKGLNDEENSGWR